MMSSMHDLDEKKLAAYLETHVNGFRGPLTAEKFSDGQSNPTYTMTSPSGHYVLRRKPTGELLKSAHAVDREYRVMSALAGSDVPVPKTYHLCTDDTVIGSMFYLMEYVDGRIYWDPTLPGMGSDRRGAIYDEINRVLAALHSIDIKTIGLADYGKTGNYVERQINRLNKQYRASETETIPSMEKVMKWLPANLPVDDGRVSLIHGDYTLYNMIFHHDEPRMLALLDWELSTLGHPYADLGFHCMQLRLPPGSSHLTGLEGIDRNTLGIPSEKDYVAKYCKRMGIDGIPNWNFYLVFSFFRLAAILQGIRKRALIGTASSQKAAEVGGMAAMLADYALSLLE
jgi:aminoglycoside phosphotransferase (APT) family kinase protein